MDALVNVLTTIGKILLALIIVFGPGVLTTILEKKKIRYIVPSVLGILLLYFIYKYITYNPGMFGDLGNIGNWLICFYLAIQLIISIIICWRARKNEGDNK